MRGEGRDEGAVPPPHYLYEFSRVKARNDVKLRHDPKDSHLKSGFWVMLVAFQTDVFGNPSWTSRGGRNRQVPRRNSVTVFLSSYFPIHSEKTKAVIARNVHRIGERS